MSRQSSGSGGSSRPRKSSADKGKRPMLSYEDTDDDDFIMSTPLPPPAPANLEPTQESEFHNAPIPVPVPQNIELGGGAKKSDIFKKHYKKIQDPNNISKVFAVCNYCGKQYSFTGGYGSLWKHVTNKHAVEAGIDRTQSQLTGYATSAPLFHYSDQNNREEMAKFISVEHLSFSFGEKIGFIDYCQNALNPVAKRVPRTTLTRTVHKLYKKGKKELHAYFNNFNGRVAICSDIWSDHWNVHSYMGITCHWIDDEWNAQKRVIAFRVFDERHTAHNIYRMIKNVFEEYNLIHKIFSISFDNAAANTASISELKTVCQPTFGGKFFHIRCACHVLNLCVQDGLKTLHEHLIPIKTAISYLWSHPQVMKEWFKFCKAHNRRPKKFPRDVPTRWNSTYELLNESLEYSDLLCSFIISNVNVSDVTIYPQQWNICRQLLDLLKVFNDATYTLSGVYYPTVHLLINECVNIAAVMQEHEFDDYLHETVGVMKSKWCQYFKKIPDINLVASVFDPRTRLTGLKDYLDIYYECLNEEMDKDKIISSIRKSILEIYNEYYSKFKETVPSQFQHTENEQPTSTMSRGQLLLMRKKKQPKVTSVASEFDVYLTTSFEIGDITGTATTTEFNILDWWKQHARQFPILALIAKDILASPVSTVAVEQAFSAGGSILDETRSSMSPESLEAQACLDDWTKAMRRIQEIIIPTNDYLFDLTDKTQTTTTDAADDSD